MNKDTPKNPTTSPPAKKEPIKNSAPNKEGSHYKVLINDKVNQVSMDSQEDKNEKKVASNLREVIDVIPYFN